MLTAILLICSFIAYAVMIGTYLPQSNYNNGMIFAVTLPKEAAKHDAILNIRSQFKKTMMNFSALMLASLIPMFFLGTSYQVLYFFVWMCILLTVLVLPFRRAHREALALKREKDWFVGERKVLHTDLRAMLLKNEQAAPYWAFAIPLALAVLLTVWWSRSGLMMLGIVAIVTVVLFAIISMLYRNAKTKVYSHNSEINVSLNQASIRIWSYTFLGLAFVEIVHFYLIGVSVLNDHRELGGFWIAWATVFTLVPLVLILYANSKIKRIVNEMLESEGRIMYSDEDEFWGNGFTYHNPHNPKVFIEKRIGIGMTVNTGTSAGKWFIGITLGVTAAVIIGVSFLLVRSELYPPVLTITAEHNIDIDYMMYSYDFSADAIIDISLVEEIPAGRRKNGEATEKAARGHFDLEGLGKSKLYVFKNNPPYIRIQLENEYIFYNEEDSKQTKEIYEQLMRLMKQEE